jgi:nucleotide-binding universal stress UspA family protein
MAAPADGAVPAATDHLFVGTDGKERSMDLIVHATDGSPEAAEALELAIELAKDTGAKLAVVAVHVPVPAGGKGIAPPVTEVEQPHGAEHLAQAAAATANAAGIDTKPYVATGDAAKEIVRLAKDLDANLIIMGSRGFGGVRGVLVGSVSRSVMTHSTVPVTVVTSRAVREPARA